MSSEKTDAEGKLSRRKFLQGAGAGAAVGAVVVAGLEEGVRIPGMEVLPIQPTAVLKASLSASPASLQVGSSVSFSATPSGGTPPYTISINCGDGTSLTAAGSHAYSSAGQFEALLTVTDSTGAKAYSVATVAVGAPPTYGQMITLNVNGADYEVAADYRWTLLDVLRDKLNLTGTKKMCDRGECGSCTVLFGGKPVLSCMVLAVEAQGQNILTIEGLRTSLKRSGTALHYIQQAFVDNDGTQCGMCTPGFIMASKALLDANPNPTAQQVKDALSGNICRCACYPEILQSVLAAAKAGS